MSIRRSHQPGVPGLSLTLACLALSALFLAGCPRRGAPDIKRWLTLLPDWVEFAVRVDVKKIVNTSYVKRLLPLLERALKKPPGYILGAVTHYIGVDPGKIGEFHLFGRMKPIRLGMIVTGSFDKAPFKVGGKARRCGKLSCRLHGSRLVLAREADLKAIMAVLDGKARSFKQSKSLKRFMRLSAHEGGINDIQVYATVLKAGKLLKFLGLDSMDGLAAFVEFEKHRPQFKIKGVLQTNRQSASRAVKKARSRLKQLVIMLRNLEARHPKRVELLKKILDSIKIKAQGEMLTASVVMGEGVGLLAAIAIPAFVKYMRRAKSSEAVHNLRLLARSSQLYYDLERVSRTGAILPRSFPPSQDWTPPMSACKFPKRRHVPKAKYWQTPTWKGLNFTLEDPHYYQYKYLSQGVGAEARFTAMIKGDLDCDGIYSFYMISGKGDGRGNMKLYKPKIIRPLE